LYWILFCIGVIAIIIGILLALIPNQVLAGAIFAGLGVVSFIGYFITRSTQSVEENLIYITRLGVIYKSNWTHLAWSPPQDTAQVELDNATTDALRQLENWSIAMPVRSEDGRRRAAPASSRRRRQV
jgi:hypothetical protein